MAAMKVPPEKPHFFRPIVPGFKHGLKIPIGYLKYLEGHDHHEHAILRRAGNKEREWPVKLNSWRFEEGWKKFVEEHDLQLGNILVFRHEGDMRFEVSILDLSTQCNRKYAENQQEEAAHITVEETFKSFELKEKLSPRIKSLKKGSSHAEAATDHSHFECNIQPYCLSSGFMYLPTKFATANGLTNVKKCPLIIRDKRQRSWDLTLSSSTTRVLIGSGWRKFVADVCLKKGDCVVFEVVTNGETPVWKFQFVTSDVETPTQKFQEKPVSNIKTSDKSSPNIEAAKDTHFSLLPHFSCTIKPYNLSSRFLFVLEVIGSFELAESAQILSDYVFANGYKLFQYVPKQFALENNLNDRKCMITVSDKQKSWTCKLYTSGRGTCIGSTGFREFCFDNRLKGGDRITFEMVSNGEKPAFRYEKPESSIKRSGKAFPYIEAAKDTHLSHPHFTCTIKLYNLSMHLLYVPRQFAQENNLNNRKCTITIKNEQKSWTCKLYRGGGVACFGSTGFREFCDANCFKCGDPVKFEMVSNGETPVFRFYDLRGSPSLQPEVKKKKLPCAKRISDKGKYSEKDAKKQRSH